MIFIIITISFIVWLFNKYYCAESDTLIHEWKYYDDDLYNSYQIKECKLCGKKERSYM